MASPIYKPSAWADVARECFGRIRTATAVFAFLSNSNYAFGATRGVGNGISAGLEAMGLPQIATAPTQGVYLNFGNNRSQGRNQSPNTSDAASQSALTLAPAAVQKFLPIGASALPTTADNGPSFISVSATPNDTGTGVQHSTGSVRLNVTEAMNCYIARVVDPAMTAATTTWVVRWDDNVSYFVLGSAGISHRDGSNSRVKIDRILQVAADAGRSTAFNLELLTYGTGAQLITGPVIMWSQFVTWPNRPHGYIVTPLTCLGGTALSDQVAGWAEFTDDYVDAMLLCIDAAAEGKRYYPIIVIDLGLNDRNRSAPHNTAAGYQANINAILDRLTTRIAALKASGSLANCVGLRALLIPIMHSLGSTASNNTLNFCYTGANAVADARSDTIVFNARQLVTNAEALRLHDILGPEHLKDTPSYELMGKRIVGVLATALFKAMGIQKAAA